MRIVFGSLLELDGEMGSEGARWNEEREGLKDEVYQVM
jgi:hypothetical protein